MAELLVKQEDGSYQKIDLGGLKLEIRGIGVVRNPGDPGWVDTSKELEEEASSDGQPL